MRKLTTILVSLFFSVLVAYAANERATPSEVIQKVNEAVGMVQKKGEAAFELFRDKTGPFVWKDSYLFVIDLDGNMHMHPFNPKLEGINMVGSKDSNGKLFIAEQISIVNGPAGEGWMEYAWVKPGEKAASQKVSFVKKVPGTKYFVGAGLFDFSKAEAEKVGK